MCQSREPKGLNCCFVLETWHKLTLWNRACTKMLQVWSMQETIGTYALVLVRHNRCVLLQRILWTFWIFALVESPVFRVQLVGPNWATAYTFLNILHLATYPHTGLTVYFQVDHNQKYFTGPLQCLGHYLVLKLFKRADISGSCWLTPWAE